MPANKLSIDFLFKSNEALAGRIWLGSLMHFPHFASSSSNLFAGPELKIQIFSAIFDFQNVVK